jgi:hypothetical protein
VRFELTLTTMESGAVETRWLVDSFSMGTGLAAMARGAATAKKTTATQTEEARIKFMDAVPDQFDDHQGENALAQSVFTW